MNDYGKAFEERIARLGFRGPDFAAMAREALRGKFGVGGDVLLGGMDRAVLESPKRFAAEMYRRFGRGSMEFYVTIVKFGEFLTFAPNVRKILWNPGTVVNKYQSEDIDQECPIERPRVRI